MTHCKPAASLFRSRCMAGNATLTAVESMKAMLEPMIATSKTHALPIFRMCSAPACAPSSAARIFYCVFNADLQQCDVAYGMNALLKSLIRPAFGRLLVAGVATAAVATSAKPAQAGVVISVGVGFGGGGYGYGYAPVYRPYPRHYAYFHRRYVPAVWVAPYPAYRYPAYRYPAYGYPAYGYPVYGRPYHYGYARYGYGYNHGYYYGHPYGYGYGRGGHRF